MEKHYNLMTIRDYCRNNKWPTLPQWNNWIYTKNIVAIKCVKKIGGRYLLDVEAWKNYIENASLNEDK